MRRRYTLAVTDEEIIAYLDEQGNISEYLRSLVTKDMGSDHVEANADPDILGAILQELRGLRQDINGKAIVTVPERPVSSTRRSAPAGLAAQAERFREGKRGDI